VILGLCGVVGGAPLLATYLLYISFVTEGDAKRMLLGEVRAAL
jgi:hypothetical protein